MTSTPAYRNDVVGETSVSANYSELALSATQFVVVQRPLRNGMISTELTELLRDPSIEEATGRGFYKAFTLWLTKVT